MNSKIRTLSIILIDFAMQLFCYGLCALLYQLAAIGSVSLSGLKVFTAALALIVIYPATLAVFKVYRIIHRYALSREYLQFFVSFVTAGIVYVAVMTVTDRYFIKLYPIYFFIAQAILTALVMLVSRIVYRVISGKEGGSYTGSVKRTLIFGCGNTCLMLLSDLKKHPEHNILPVVGADDDISKKGRMICGIRVEGTREDVPALCRKYGIELIIIAIPSMGNAARAEIISYFSDTNAVIQVMPQLSDFHEGSGDVVEKLRDFTMDELLGREAINIKNSDIADFIRGKTVLVTGGGGSIGSEICRQIATNSPKKIIILDIYENNAYDIQQELRMEYADRLDLETVIASVRDYERINAIMALYKPDIVIHAAAHKHVPLMEDSPQEAIKNNVFGTYNTALAAKNNNVEKFILISTDKAVNPTNIMGASKRICEMIIQSMNGGATKFSAVRFGNVLGSNGSVIPLFKKQIEAGGPVTITHPDIIRFFMTIPEAVQLVLLASCKAEGGEIFVLNMGQPVKIADLAKKMIQLSGKKPGEDIEIKYTGLRPGEKLYEELMMNDENLEKTQNDKIFIGHFTDFDKDSLLSRLEELREIARNNDLSREAMLSSLESKIAELVPTFHRTPESKVSSV